MRRRPSRRHERGASVFIVLLVITLLTAIGKIGEVPAGVIKAFGIETDMETGFAIDLAECLAGGANEIAMGFFLRGDGKVKTEDEVGREFLGFGDELSRSFCFAAQLDDGAPVQFHGNAELAFELALQSGLGGGRELMAIRHGSGDQGGAKRFGDESIEVESGTGQRAGIDRGL